MKIKNMMIGVLLLVALLLAGCGINVHVDSEALFCHSVDSHGVNENFSIEIGEGGAACGLNSIVVNEKCDSVVMCEESEHPNVCTCRKILP